MKKHIIWVVAGCFLLTGCIVRKFLPEKNPSSVAILKDKICINAPKNYVLNSYMVSSLYVRSSIIAISGNEPLHLTYPDTCFPAQIKPGYAYAVEYSLNEKPYTFSFAMDLNENVFAVEN